MMINEVQIESIDGIILPGGMPGTSNLEKCEKLINIIKICAEKKLLIAAIFPDAEIEKCLVGANINGKDVNICENIITSKGPGTAFQFAFSVVEYLRGTQVKQKFSLGMQLSQ